MAKALYVIGTNTDIGKTYVSGLIVKSLKDNGVNIGYYKPVLSGAIRANNTLVPGDVQHVYQTANLQGDYTDAVTYMFEPAVSPHLAFEMEHKTIDLNVIKNDFLRYQKQHDYILVEGCGGLICPIFLSHNQTIMQEDIIKLLNLKTVLITDAGLGTINHTLLTTHYAKQKQIAIEGIIVNNYNENNAIHQNNIKIIEELTGIKIIACVPKQANISSNVICHSKIKKAFMK